MSLWTEKLQRESGAYGHEFHGSFLQRPRTQDALRTHGRSEEQSPSRAARGIQTPTDGSQPAERERSQSVVPLHGSLGPEASSQRPRRHRPAHRRVLKSHRAPAATTSSCRQRSASQAAAPGRQRGPIPERSVHSDPMTEKGTQVPPPQEGALGRGNEPPQVSPTRNGGGPYPLSLQTPSQT